MTPEIQTYTGRMFNIVEPRVEDVNITDIAVALSRAPRYNGHTREFYSVAEHSVRLMDQVSREAQFLALMHDAAEAYIGDIPTPIKRAFPGIEQAENRIWEAIRERFGIEAPDALKIEVRNADLRMLATEREWLMAPGHEWSALRGVEPFDIPLLRPWPEQQSAYMFIERFRELAERTRQLRSVRNMMERREQEVVPDH